MIPRPDDCPRCGTRHYGSPVAACVACEHRFTRESPQPRESGAVCTTCNNTRVRDGAPCVCTGEAP